MASKGIFTANTNKWDQLISNTPSTSSSSSSNSGSFKSRPDTEELFLGDDCDSNYELMLLNSGFLDYLNTEETVVFSTGKATSRLELVLSHFQPTSHAKK